MHERLNLHATSYVYMYVRTLPIPNVHVVSLPPLRSRLIQLSRIRRMCRLLVDCDMNTPTRKALEAGIAPNAADVRSVVGMVGGGEKTVVQVRTVTVYM